MNEDDRTHVERTPSVMLDVVFGLVLVALLVATLRAGVQLGPIEKGAVAVLLGLYVQVWGMLFFLSYLWRDASYLLRGLMWLCENKSSPRGTWTALLWGAFAVAMGTWALFIGLGVIPS